MDVQQVPPPPAESREQQRYARLSGRWIVLARGAWITLVILTLVIFFASLPVYVAQLQTPCDGAACEYQQLTPGKSRRSKGWVCLQVITQRTPLRSRLLSWWCV